MERKLATALMIAIAIGAPSQAQVVRDLSLPTPTKVTPSGNFFDVSEGTKAGANLFHSFESFSIPEDKIVRFINNETSTLNVISRVTGAFSSEIYGKIEAAGSSPNFNLFLINPQGINFGPNAKLDIGGSFLATTSNSVKFGYQGFLETANPNDPSLLSVNPSAFLFNVIRPQKITSEASITVPSGNNILLLGGDIKLNGGSLIAPDGRIELGSLTGFGSANLNLNGRNLSLGFPDSIERSNISIANGAIVDVTDKGSGGISIFARNIEVSENSSIFSGIINPLGENGPPTLASGISPGSIVLNATKEITIKGPISDDLGAASIDNSALNNTIGDAGKIFITAESLGDFLKIRYRLFGFNKDIPFG